MNHGNPSDPQFPEYTPEVPSTRDSNLRYVILGLAGYKMIRGDRTPYFTKAKTKERGPNRRTRPYAIDGCPPSQTFINDLVEAKLTAQSSGSISFALFASAA